MANKDSICPSIRELEKEVPYPEVLENLLTRVSSTKVTEPAPSREEIAVIVKAAMRAPDWRHLKPYHFTYFGKEDKEVLRNILNKLYRSEEFQTVLKKFGIEEFIAEEKVEEALDHCPGLLCVSTRYKEDEIVQEWEQFACVNAAVYGAQLAGRALGYESLWVTARYEEMEFLKEFCGVTGRDQIVAFIIIGTDTRMPRKEIKSRPLDYLTFASDRAQELAASKENKK